MKRRPVLRYFGGKFLMAEWIVSHFPKHKIYCEPFGGAASVLLRKEVCYAEIYNDLDGEIVNLFSVLRYPAAANRLIELLEFTPYSRQEFYLSYKTSSDPIEQARRTIVRSFMGFSSDAATRAHKTGFRSTGLTTGRYVSRDWTNYPISLRMVIERLRGVCLEQIDALHCINKYDTSNTLFYVDPPYMSRVRQQGNEKQNYKFEMNDWEHKVLCELLLNMKGMVIISGLDSELYRDLFSEWHVESKLCAAQKNGGGQKQNLEMLWMNKAVAETLP